MIIVFLQFAYTASTPPEKYPQLTSSFPDIFQRSPQITPEASAPIKKASFAEKINLKNLCLTPLGIEIPVLNIGDITDNRIEMMGQTPSWVRHSVYKAGPDLISAGTRKKRESIFDGLENLRSADRITDEQPSITSSRRMQELHRLPPLQ